MDFSRLPTEIRFVILECMDIRSILFLSQTCTEYTTIITDDYNYLWKKLLERCMDWIYEYKTMEEFNQKNKTLFEGWYNVYHYVHNITLKDFTSECMDGHIDVVKYLLSKHIDSETLNLSLTSACYHGQTDIVKCLLQHGTGICDEEGFCGLTIACENGYLDIVKYLMEYVANIQYDIQHNIGTALVESSRHGHLDIVKYLIQHGVNVNYDDTMALKVASESGYIHVVKYLISQGANINDDNDEGTAIEYASSEGHLDVVKYLVESGGDINKALSVAYALGETEIIQYLKRLNIKK